MKKNILHQTLLTILKIIYIYFIRSFMSITISYCQKSHLSKNIFDYILQFKIKTENISWQNPESTSFDKKFKSESEF